MRILQICKKFPYPPHDGEVIAILNLSKAFVAQGHELDILTLNTNKHHTDVSSVPKSLTETIHFYHTDINTDIVWSKALAHALLNQPYNIWRFFSEKFEQQLIELLKKKTYDIIQLEGLPILLYIDSIRKYSKAKIAYRAHNVEHEIWLRLLQHESSFLKKNYYGLLAAQVKKFEINASKKVDLILAISSRDQAFFTSVGCRQAMHVVPACIDEVKLSNDEVTLSHKDIFFLGALDWLPNQEGLRWFIEQCLPLVTKELPDVVLHIAGRHMPTSFLELKQKNVKVYGEVENAQVFMQERGLMIVPLLSGGGMRIKIIEAMMMQKAIVSTAIGAEGIDCSDGKNIAIADDASTFSRAIINLLEQPHLQVNIAKEARVLALQHYSSMSVTSDLIHFYKTQLS
jgi:glycosyltransferase involved in cell wall biosynthesis